MDFDSSTGSVASGIPSSSSSSAYGQLGMNSIPTHNNILSSSIICLSFSSRSFRVSREAAAVDADFALSGKSSSGSSSNASSRKTMFTCQYPQIHQSLLKMKVLTIFGTTGFGLRAISICYRHKGRVY
jgi:hypothetical protein